MKKEVREKKHNVFSLINIIFFVLMLAISIIFYYSLDKVLGKGFGFKEIGVALLFAIVVSSIFFFIRALMINNAYLAVGVGLLAIAGLAYGFSLRYAGNNSTVFMLIGIALMIIYLGINFWKFKSQDKEDKNEYDDE